MNENDNLIIFLKLFKNRPYHLAKYLTDNSAFNKNFINKINKSDVINKLKSDIEIDDVYFMDITQMDDYYNSLLESTKNKNSDEICKELNIKLDVLITEQKFEEAAKLRDYMIKKSIKRFK